MSKKSSPKTTPKSRRSKPTVKTAKSRSSAKTTALPDAGSPPKKSRKKGDVQSATILTAVGERQAYTVSPTDVLTHVVVDPDSVDAEGNVIKWLPGYETSGAACVDLRVNIPDDVHGNRVLAIPHRCCVKIDCGFSMQLPEGYKAEVAIRSGWSSKGLILLNGPGQIDTDFRGRIAILVCNVGKEILTLKHGDRVGQMWPTPIYRFAWDEVEELDPTDRGEGGFGSTGVS